MTFFIPQWILMYHVVLCRSMSYHISAYLVHISAVGSIALHTVRTGSTLDALTRLHAPHPWVAGVGHTGGTRLHSPHPWGEGEDRENLLFQRSIVSFNTMLIYVCSDLILFALTDSAACQLYTMTLNSHHQSQQYECILSWQYSCTCVAMKVFKIW